MNCYKALNNQEYSFNEYSIVPIRSQDRFSIMKWRNEQIYHLRQDKPLTVENQEYYFKNVVSKLFNQVEPNQILFSFLEKEQCIGYGGLVYINWIDKNAEISFIMETALENERFDEIWSAYLKLLEQVAFKELNLHKIYTYAFDVRPHLYTMLSKADFIEEARLKEHCLFHGNYIDVLMHSKINHPFSLRLALDQDVAITFDWATNKKIRQYAIQKGEILFENHKKWFLNKIISSDCVYFIAQVNKTLIGSIRFDINENKEALISFLLDPRFQGKGYGKKILEKGCKELLKLKQISKIIGVVNIENIPSFKIFKSLGFERESEIDYYITFHKEIQK